LPLKTPKNVPLPFSPSPTDETNRETLVKSLPSKTTTKFFTATPTTAFPHLVTDEERWSTKIPVKSLTNSIVKTLPVLSDDYIHKWYRETYPLDYKRYGAPIYGYEVLPHQTHYANEKKIEDKISQISADLSRLEKEIKKEGEVIEMSRNEKSILRQQFDIKSDRMSTNIDVNFTTQPSPLSLGSFGPNDLSTAMTTSYPRYTFKVLNGPNNVEMNMAESQKQHSDKGSLRRYSYNVLPSTTPMPEMDEETRTEKLPQRYKYRIVNQTTPRPDTDSTPKRYTYGLVTEPSQLETRSDMIQHVSTHSDISQHGSTHSDTDDQNDNLKTESVNKYTYRVVPSTAASFQVKHSPDSEVQPEKMNALHDPNDGLYHPEQAPTLSEVFPTTFEENFGSKLVIDSRNQISRVKIGSRSRGTTTRYPGVHLMESRPTLETRQEVTSSNVKNEIANGENVNEKKEEMVKEDPNEEWSFIDNHQQFDLTQNVKNESSEIEQNKMDKNYQNTTDRPIVEYEGKELQRLSHEVEPQHPVDFQQINYREELKPLLNTPAPRDFNTPKHNALSGKLNRTPLYPTAIRTLAPRVDNFGPPPTPQHVRLPGIRPDNKHFQPPFQVTQPVWPYGNDHHHDSAENKMDHEHHSQKHFFESTLKTSFSFEPLTIEKVKETINQNSIFHRNDPLPERENNLRPQPRRPEPSQRPAFSVDKSTRYPHHFSVVTPNSYIDFKVKPNTPAATPSQASFTDVLPTSDVTRVEEPFQTTFATTRVDTPKTLDTTRTDDFVGSTVDDNFEAFRETTRADNFENFVGTTRMDNLEKFGDTTKMNKFESFGDTTKMNKFESFGDTTKMNNFKGYGDTTKMNNFKGYGDTTRMNNLDSTSFHSAERIDIRPTLPVDVQTPSETTDFMSTVPDHFQFGTDEKLNEMFSNNDETMFGNDQTTYFGKMVSPTAEMELTTTEPMIEREIISTDILRAPIESTTPTPIVDFTTTRTTTTTIKTTTSTTIRSDYTIVDYTVQTPAPATLPAYNPFLFNKEFQNNDNPFPFKEEFQNNGNPFPFKEEIQNNGNPFSFKEEIQNNDNPFILTEEVQKPKPVNTKLDSLSSPLPPPTVLPYTVTAPFFLTNQNQPHPTKPIKLQNERRRRPTNPIVSGTLPRVSPKISKRPPKRPNMKNLLPSFSFGKFSTASETKYPTILASTR
jgi:hypothetical protein